MLFNPIKKWVAIGLLFTTSGSVLAHGSHSHTLSAEEKKISQGEFDDKQVAPRPLSDWDGVWQSVYPLLEKGALAPVFKAKAAAQHKSEAEITEYYRTGYQTDIDRIEIENGLVEFFQGQNKTSCHYENAGYKILTYPSGKRGVRYLFECRDPASKAPRFLQFSDHRIAPHHSDHFHIFVGNESEQALLTELHHWPTYFPYQMMEKEVIDDMLHH
ncbi:ZinT family metal-binding protein [Rosenbergiella australiborealis]|uniref:ZinT/AdcA family metal-binding protein n=1 Tax=Rosenbergiella australiborealis TaxID=1544696 RepID=A0ABS5T466_9GAMM|nr:ZinT/AdcA family metal-binding protein [Rosenbergiella australiborealis]MBT0727145.1 ZinT/AdcA family metal-binding protein [Rosenbergiella australiborealis]